MSKQAWDCMQGCVRTAVRLRIWNSGPTRSRLLLSWGKDCASSLLGVACRLAASCSASFRAAWAAREALITLLAPAATMLFT